MILTTHALTGAVLGKYISNPWLIAILVIPIHFLMDLLRHGEYLSKHSKTRETLWKVAKDLCIGFGIIGIYIIVSHPSPEIIRNILIGAFFSMFPDLLTFLHWQMKIPCLGKLYHFHTVVIHHYLPSDSPTRIWALRNAANDIIFCSIAIIFLFF